MLDFDGSLQLVELVVDGDAISLPMCLKEDGKGISEGGFIGVLVKDLEVFVDAKAVLNVVSHLGENSLAIDDLVPLVFPE